MQLLEEKVNGRCYLSRTALMGRDALVGIALFLSHLAKSNMKCSALRKLYPHYVIAKKKLALDSAADFKKITDAVKGSF